MATDIDPKRVTKDLENEKFATNANGKTVVRVEDEAAASRIPGGLLSGIVFDYGSVAYPDGVTEVFTFREGGSGGVVVATVTVTYTSAAKNRLSTFEVVTP